MFLSPNKHRMLVVILASLVILTAFVAVTPAFACAGGSVCNLQAGFTCPQTVSFSFDFTAPIIGSPGLASITGWDVTAVNNNTSFSATTGAASLPGSDTTISGTLIVPASNGDTITVTLLQFGQQVD